MSRRLAFLSVSLVGGCLFPDVGNLDGTGTDAEASLPDVIGADAPADIGGPEVEAGTMDWCASQDAGYLLCSDFDQAGGVTQGFDIGLTTNGVGGSFNLDTATFVSSPRSALGIASPFSAGETTGDIIVADLWPLGTTPASLSCAFQWDPVALSTTPNDYGHVIEIALWSDAAATTSIVTYNLNMEASGELIMLEYGTSLNQSHNVTSSIVSGSWTNVSLALTSSTYAVTVGNTMVNGNLGAPFPSTAHITVEIGPAYFAGDTTAPSPGWTFGYDNVICY
jgi:hypothetical protein